MALTYLKNDRNESEGYDGNILADIHEWVTRPFVEPLDVGHWIAVLALSATLAWGWSRILDHVLEE